MIEFKISRVIEGKLDYTVTLTEEQLGLIYDALNDYPQWNDEDDNPTSVIMSKLYNMLEC